MKYNLKFVVILKKILKKECCPMKMNIFLIVVPKKKKDCIYLEHNISAVDLNDIATNDTI